MAARRRIAARRGWPANLYQNGQGYFYFRHPGTGQTYGLGKELKVAVANVRHTNAELLRRAGDVSLLERIDGSTDKFSDWCHAYLKAREDAGGNEKTLQGIRAQVGAILAADIAAQPIGAITPMQIADFVKRCVTERGANTAAKVRGRLYDVFREAIEHGKLPVGQNPVEVVLKPKVSVSRGRLSLDEYKAIMKVARADKKMAWAANAIELALHTTQRREDVKEMRFDDARDGFLYVVQHKGKNPSKLKIPLALGLKATGRTLAAILATCKESGVESDYCVHYARAKYIAKPGDSPPLTRISETFAALRDKAGVTAKDGNTPPSFHELRSLGARLYEEEYGTDFLQALLGHKSEKMTALYRDSRGTEWTEVKIVER